MGNLLAPSSTPSAKVGPHGSFVKWGLIFGGKRLIKKRPLGKLLGLIACLVVDRPERFFACDVGQCEGA